MSEPLEYQSPPKADPKMAGRLKRALIQAGIENVFVLLIASTFLDGGQVLSICLAIAIGFWVAVLLILRRRMHRLTQFDLVFIAFGYLVLHVPVVILIALS